MIVVHADNVSAISPPKFRGSINRTASVVDVTVVKPDDIQMQETATLPTGLVAVVEEDRRKERRTACDVVIMPCGTMAAGKFRKARMVDCSPHGIGLLATRPLPVGDPFLLKVRLQAHHPRRLHRGELRRARWRHPPHRR